MKRVNGAIGCFFLSYDITRDSDAERKSQNEKLRMITWNKLIPRDTARILKARYKRLARYIMT